MSGIKAYHFQIFPCNLKKYLPKRAVYMVSKYQITPFLLVAGFWQFHYTIYGEELSIILQEKMPYLCGL